VKVSLPVSAILIALIVVVSGCVDSAGNTPEISVTERESRSASKTSSPELKGSEAFFGYEDGCANPGNNPLKPLEAGVAVGDLYAPVGLSLAGYGGRDQPSHPLSFYLGASTGRIDRLQVKAVTLDNGQDRLVIVRLPLVLIVDTVYQMVIEKVCELAQVDLTEKLWINVNHTHFGPGRFFPVPFFVAPAGGDAWYGPAVEGMVESIAETVIVSMESLEPAAIAIGLDENFDPNDRITFDRRCEDGPPSYKENRLLVARIDREDGSPLAVLLALAAHGTFTGGSRYSSDALGWMEYMLQERYDEPVEVMALNTSAGDQTPNYGVGNGQGSLAKMEILGNLVADKAQTLMSTMSPSRNFTFETAHRRFEISRSIIGYTRDEFGAYNPWNGDWYTFRMGALACGEIEMTDHGSISDCNNPSTQLIDGYLGCAVPLYALRIWMDPWLQVSLSSIRLGEHYLMLFPGELAANLAHDAIVAAAQAHGLDESNVHAFGYSNDAHFYLLTEASWYQGGYETSMSMWGPKFGPWVGDRLSDLTGQLLTPQDEDNISGAAPAYLHENHLFKPVEPELSDRIPQVLAQPSAEVDRFEIVTFEWSGGFTGVDNPSIVVEFEGAKGFEPAVLPTGRIFTDQDFRTILDYIPSPNYDALLHPAARLHKWRFTWETTPEVPAGIYRLRATGSWWKGAKAVDYELYSEPFEIIPNANLTASDLTVNPVGGDEYELSLKGWYPPLTPGSYRLRHPDYRPSDASPVESGTANVTIEVDGGTEESCLLTFDTATGLFTGSFSKTQTGLTHQAVLETGALSDAWGNLNGDSLAPIVF
jgi:hypothetical protein